MRFDVSKAVEGGATPRYPLTSVDNALKLILMVRERRVVRISEASRELGVAGSTAHRLLAMLQHRGFVRQDPATRAYVLGPELVQNVREPWKGLNLERHARPLLERIVAKLGETAHLCALEGTETVFLTSVESKRLLRTGSRAGLWLPAHCTSGGKAMLAQLPVEELRELYSARSALQRMTDRSISKLTALERELQNVARQGYALNREESEREIGAVAVALELPPGPPRMALATSMPISRLPARRVPEVVRTLREGVAELERELDRSSAS